MAEEQGFWDGQYYGPDDFTNYFTDFYTNGIKGDNVENLQVVANTNMTLEVKAGTAYIDGHFFKPKASKTITLPESDTEFARIDVIVVRCDNVNQQVYLDVVVGEPLETPVMPEIHRNSNVYEIGLAAVTVNPNTMAITQADIQDLRFNNNYCGIVTGKIETINTTDLFAQYGAEWDLLRAAIGQDEEAVIAAWAALNTTKSVNGVVPIEGTVTLHQGDIPSGNGAYQMPFKTLRGTVSTTGTVTVTFAEAFSTVPLVLLSFIPTSPNASTQYSATVTNVSTISFTAQQNRGSGSSHAASEGQLNWVAFGV